jgi:transcriptional regulator with XRE-family HTH domain
MIGRSLKTAREHHGLTQDQVAERLGVEQGTYSGWESRGKTPGEATLAKLLELLPHPVLEESVARVRKLRPRQSRMIGSSGAQTTDQAQRMRTLRRAVAARRSAEHGEPRAREKGQP